MKNIIIEKFNNGREDNLEVITKNHFNTTLSLNEFTKAVMAEMVKEENESEYTHQMSVCASKFQGFENFIVKMCYNVKFSGNYASGKMEDEMEAEKERQRAAYRASL